jgi:metal-responsive CopG/Arc/MetJ family transcriptional regulator
MRDRIKEMQPDKEKTMGTAKVKLDKDLLDKVKKYAQLSGYTSDEEFITHCLEKEMAKLEGSDSEEEIKKKLKGLGYIS